MDIVLRPIGYVRHGYSDDYIRSIMGGVEGYIEVLQEYVDGLVMIEGFSHLIVIAYLDKVGEEARRVLRVRHRRLARLGVRIDDLPEVGVFATDSPHRPNPLALSIVKLLAVEGNKLRVSGLDLFNGTPVLDIKPYEPSRAVKEVETPPWYRELEKRTREKLGAEGPL